MMAAMEEMMAANQLPGTAVNAIDAPGTVTSATTPTTTTTAPHQTGGFTSASIPATHGDGSHTTIQVVLPEMAQYDGGRGGPPVYRDAAEDEAGVARAKADRRRTSPHQRNYTRRRRRSSPASTAHPSNRTWTTADNSNGQPCYLCA